MKCFKGRKYKEAISDGDAVVSSARATLNAISVQTASMYAVSSFMKHIFLKIGSLVSRISTINQKVRASSIRRRIRRQVQINSLQLLRFTKAPASR